VFWNRRLQTYKRCRIFSLQVRNRCALPIPRRRGNPFKFAHPSRDISITFGSQDVELSSMNRVEIMLTLRAKRSS
jgi:hypothetical protein